MKGYENANQIALDLWEELYSGPNLIAVTDTFSTEAFFKACNTFLSPNCPREYLYHCTDLCS